MTRATSGDVLAERIAAAVREHPAVERLDAGPLGVVATHLPGQRVHGVRAGEAGEPVEIAVVLRMTGPLPELTGELRALVRGIAGDVAVHVTVTDITTPDDPSTVDIDRPGGSGTRVR
ncbi:hypothetical protein [Amycolatopsis sp. CA-230715]|uniref:hypothetical protein n=1 Tax=Amycolatopsis sp. CA-230715 TaxID=2745196 RepID=UPI001C022400|nr:hypothetical protein [Amycolatopsis sp. CA-230715]QWF76848.1 hypothetical protein HUW46_00228 [Amycolatopsis sp. CA-230715]